jgi:hypothetical protein
LVSFSLIRKKKDITNNSKFDVLHFGIFAILWKKIQKEIENIADLPFFISMIKAAEISSKKSMKAHSIFFVVVY